MSQVAIWGRSKEKSLIGIGERIPWHVPSDLKRFRRLTTGSNMVVGRKTYETFPNRTLPNRKIFVLSSDQNYPLSDPINHHNISSIEFFTDFKDDLYIAGGSSIYFLFLSHPVLKPDFIVDSVYEEELLSGTGQEVSIQNAVTLMQKNYDPDFTDFLDNMCTTIWIKKGVEKNQPLYHHLKKAIEEKE